MAVTLDAAELAAALGVESAIATRLLPVASALVEKYAPAAPEAIQNEATIRTSGWLSEQPAAAVRSERIGDIQTDYSPSHLSALRHSGAMALLTGWKVRRGGTIG